ncbi:50S ribosomal protein L25 [Enterobacteriaceae endosymbiont of Neohaemonia nigricornis]|uniref:50S ribosomal protein L25 n=1 Tax=Enterobacteriaceae endosymbiont of Neohaemonia nigricornis TaxID=2675792 RepID=UPI00144A252F|nr:50S ribosomal protein L25 [Enterobacteriaceae endosymbiont of Neohaemonia nigricornis]QJC30261.1 50S ribosomal protein L25 [Enterobacteriaceae endosymbiont of Neohaemonia nigricornis]
MNTIKIFQRLQIGKKFNKILRINNKIPAIIYGKNIIPIPIFIYNKDILNINITSFNDDQKKIIKLINYKNKIIKTQILNIQYHPYKNRIIYHIDFLYIKECTELL